MGIRNIRNRGFTLIEILIVVVILGILAAIVIPQFTDASDDAMEASVRSQLQTIRSQIELFNVQHPQAPYDSGTALGVAFWDDLLAEDYLQQAPRNPFQNANTTTAITVAAAPAPGVGWVWAAGAGTDHDLFAVDGTGALFAE